MRHATRIGRLTMLAVGLGIGAAVAATPGTASADPLPPFDPNDFAISVDGVTLFQEGFAAADSGPGGIAIADGAFSHAIATGGIFDSAFAYGNFSGANTTGGNFDSASVIGSNGTAEAGTGNFDSATVFGNNGSALAEFGSGDRASVVDTGSNSDTAVAGGIHTGLGTVLGSNDIASVVGTGSTAEAGANLTTAGDFDLAAVFGDMLHAIASGGNFLTDILP